MTKHRRAPAVSGEQGFALVYTAVVMTGLLLFTGLAVDSGRGYMVKAQLSKAVDGAALGAARNLNSGDPRGEATRIFRANFPPGYLGTSSASDPTAAPGFFAIRTDEAAGVNVVTITAAAVLPTTFMRLASFYEMNVGAVGEATRRMVDLSLVLDVSSSIGGKWPAVREAAKTFVNSFDQAHDRVSLIFFGNTGKVIDAMPASRGFDKAKVMSDIPSTLPGGSTAMVEGLYRGWDELQSVPNGQQSGVRVIVLFTDGASNSVPGNYPAEAGIANGLRTWDFPDNGADPDSQTHLNPKIEGLYDTGTGTQDPTYSLPFLWSSNSTLVEVPFLPATSWHSHHRSAGIPTSFPLQSATLRVNGSPQSSVRGLRHWNGTKFPAEVWNINNAARNLVEIIANEARNETTGDYRVRIYTIGMGELVRYLLGTIPEKPEDILMRAANDARSPDYNSAQLEGKYYFAATEAEVGPAFQALQNQIIRLSR